MSGQNIKDYGWQTFEGTIADYLSKYRGVRAGEYLRTTAWGTKKAPDGKINKYRMFWSSARGGLWVIE